MGRFAKYAEEELRRAGLYDKDSSYGGMIPAAVLELVKTHEAQNHSGGSHAIVLQIFNKVITFKPLSPLTDDPAEWRDVSYGGEPMWQSTRQPDAFSTDAGKTWYSVETPRALPQRTVPHK